MEQQVIKQVADAVVAMRNGKVAATTPRRFTGDKMKMIRLDPTAITLFIIAICLACAGCNSPTKQAYTAELTFNGIGRQVVALHDEGKLRGNAYEAVAVAMNFVAGQFPELERAAEEAEANKLSIAKTFRFNGLIREVNKAIDDLTAKLLAAKQAKGTKPTSTMIPMIRMAA